MVGEPKTLHLHDFWLFEPNTSSQNHLLFIFGDTRIPKKIKKYGNMFEHISVFNEKYRKSNLSKFWTIFGNGGDRKMMKIRFKHLGNIGYEINLSQRT